MVVVQRNCQSGKKITTVVTKTKQQKFVVKFCYYHLRMILIVFVHLLQNGRKQKEWSMYVLKQTNGRENGYSKVMLHVMSLRMTGPESRNRVLSSKQPKEKLKESKPHLSSLSSSASLGLHVSDALFGLLQGSVRNKEVLLTDCVQVCVLVTLLKVFACKGKGNVS